MAESNSHKLGQIIGDILELAIEPHLAEFARQHRLYLDRKGPRPCRPASKVSWSDINGSVHDLDFVLERNGSLEKQGTPVAFIETAWRRYTRHSRAKAQEIQGAIEPLVTKYRHSSPFKGVVIAGEFTPGALAQLRALGFKVVHIPYETVVHAFSIHGVNVSFDEATSERLLARKVAACEKLNRRQLHAVAQTLLSATNPELIDFFTGLSAAIRRAVESVRILALFGAAQSVATIAEAVTVITTLDEKLCDHPFNRYELRITFNNGDRIDGDFQSKADAIQFLRQAGG